MNAYDKNSKETLKVCIPPPNLGSFFPFTHWRYNTSVPPSNNFGLSTLTINSLSISTNDFQMETSLVEIPEHL